MLDRIKSLFFTNRSTKQTVAKNTFWLLVSNVFSRLIRAALVIYAAHILSPREWGAFNYAMSLVAFFIIFADFGVNAVMTRESARDPNQQEKYFSTSFFIKIVASIFIVIFLIVLYPIILPFLTSSAGDYALISILIPIVAFTVIFDSLRDFGAALSRAWEKMEIEGIIQIVTNIAIVVIGVVAMRYSPTAKSLAYGYTLGTALGMIIAFIPFKHYFKTLFSKFSWKSVGNILASSWPFGMMGVMGSIMLNTDSVIIGWLRSIQDVAYYSAGLRIMSILYILPGAIITAFFPTFAKVEGEKERFGSIIEKSIKLMSLIALPLTVGGVILARQIIIFLYGNRYAPGISSFVLMSMNMLFVYVAAMIGNALFALKREMKLFGYVALAMVGNLIFDLIFIPIWGIAGSALSTLINSMISTWYIIWLLKREVPFKFFRNLGKSACASIVMGLLVYIMSLIHIPIIINIVLGAAIYFIVILLIKEESVTELVASSKRAVT